MTGDGQAANRMDRFKSGLDEALLKGCGDPEGGLLQIEGGPWVPCPGCKDCALGPKLKELLDKAKKAQEL